MAYKYTKISKSALKGFEDLIPVDIFEEGMAEYIGALDDDKTPVGVIAYKAQAAEVLLLFINVVDEHESEKIEEELLDRLVEEVTKSEELFAISCVYPDNADYKYMCRAIENNSLFEVKGGQRVSLITPECRMASAAYQKLKSCKGETVAFADIDISARDGFYKYIKKNKMAFTDVTDEPYLMEDLSICTLNNKNEVTACILFKRPAEGELELSYMMARPRCSKDMAVLLSEAARRLDSKYPEDLLVINTVNSQSAAMVDKIFGVGHEKQEIKVAFML